MPIIVFNMGTPGNLKRVLQGERVGTTVHWDETQAAVERVPA